MANTLVQRVISQRKRNESTLLKHLVDKWMVENGDRLFSNTEEDFALLRQLFVRSATRDKTVFSPSGANACARFLVLEKFEEFTPLQRFDSRTQTIFDDGNWRHLRWQMLFHKMGLLEDAEVFKSKGKWRTGGSFDVRLWLRVGTEKKLVILDIKGANASKWNHVNHTKRAEYNHVLQVHMYMYLHNIDTAIVWYENKNTNEICEIRIKRNPNIIRKALQRQRYMRKYLRARAFPKEECDVGNRKDRKYTWCHQRENCVRLPVHLISNGEVFKIAEPRKRSDDPIFKQFNLLPLTTFAGHRGERRRYSKKRDVSVI